MDESTRRVWFEVLLTLPFPAAVLDDTYRYVFLNHASAVDWLLERGRIGDTDLGGSAGDPAALAQAFERHAHYERALLTQEPVTFEERGAPEHEGGRHSVWICIPFHFEGHARLLVADVSANLAAVDPRSAPRVELMRRVTREIRAPLTALTSLAATLASDLSGAQQARARLIEESGRLLLGQLKRMVDEAEPVQERGCTGREA